MRIARHDAGQGGVSLHGIRSVFNSLRIHQKIVLEFLLFVFLVYAVGIAIGLNVQQRVRNDEKRRIESVVQSLAHSIDRDFENLVKQQQQLVYDYNTQRLASMMSLSDMGDVYEMVNRIQGRISVLRNASVYVDKVALCLVPMNRCISSEPVYEKMTEVDLRILGLYYAGNGISQVFQDGAGLYVVQPLTRHNLSFPSTRIRSSCYVRLSVPALVTSFRDSRTSDGMSFFLLREGRVLLGTDSDGSDSAMRQATTRALTIGSGTETVRQDGRRFLVVRERIPSLGMELAVCCDDNVLTRESSRYSIWLFLLTAVMLSSLLMFTRFSNHMIEQPIRQFVKAFQEVENNNLDIVIEHESHDEFAYLYAGFNSMIRNMKHAIRQAYQEKVSAQRAELKQLQSQINPHFLYNSFFQIYRMSRIEDNEGAAQLSLKLGEYYRYITRNGSDIVPLGQEYAHARNYADIQGIRFGRRIEATFSGLPEHLAQIPVPRLILQPILENAYEHGLRNVESEGRITIDVHESENDVRISIGDNGAGLPEDRLAHLSQCLREPEQSQEITGIINVSRRLMLRQGSAGVDIETPPEGGFRVNLTLRRQPDPGR